ncbi:hypothetical protein N8S81_25665, partial [Enterobacter hormaechei subsp. hoffmannii]|nr:hypothetical protein [Enterobacter hormaechei subsp. hoffmannii]
VVGADAGIAQQQASGGALVLHGVMSPVLVASILIYATRTRDTKTPEKGQGGGLSRNLGFVRQTLT